MYASSVLFAVAGFAKLVAALSSDPSYPYFVSPAEFDPATAADYCESQRNTCFDLCYQQFSSNECFSDSFVWECTCSGRPTPNITEYMNTIPFFQCQQFVADCKEATDDANEQMQCENTPCPTKDPQRVAAAASASRAMVSESLAQATMTPTASMGSMQTPSSRGGSGGGSGSGDGDAGTTLNVSHALLTGGFVIALIGLLQVGL